MYENITPPETNLIGHELIATAELPTGLRADDFHNGFFTEEYIHLILSRLYPNEYGEDAIEEWDEDGHGNIVGKATVTATFDETYIGDPADHFDDYIRDEFPGVYEHGYEMMY